MLRPLKEARSNSFEWPIGWKHLYGLIFHAGVERLIKNLPVTKQSLRQAFKNAPDVVFNAAWQKLRWLVHSNLAHLVRKFVNSEISIATELVFYDKQRKKFYVPDIVLIDYKRNRVVVIEIKSGKHYHISQLRKYARIVNKWFPNWEVIVIVFLAGLNQLKVLKNNRIYRLERRGSQWTLTPLQPSVVSGTTLSTS